MRRSVLLAGGAVLGLTVVLTASAAPVTVGSFTNSSVAETSGVTCPGDPA